MLEGTNNAKFVQYTSGNAAEAWFGENALQLDNERQIIIKFFLFLSNSSLFYFSWKYIKVHKYRHGWMIVILTNLYIMGDMAKQAFIYFELLNRLSGMFQRMWFLPFAIVVSKIKFNTLNYLERCAYFLMFFMFYDYLKYLFAPTKGMTMFLWDKI